MRQAGEDYERLVRARDTLLDPLRWHVEDIPIVLCDMQNLQHLDEA